ncbi:hypothetical protein A2U01_0084544, partial [Trifolium medium]|nr:hypothetical protein [Trifolium medium]
VGHPFVITTLCERLQVPTRDTDDIKGLVDPLGRKFFLKAQRDLQAATPPHPQDHQQQHQVPPHFPPAPSVFRLRDGDGRAQL